MTAPLNSAAHTSAATPAAGYTAPAAPVAGGPVGPVGPVPAPGASPLGAPPAPAPSSSNGCLKAFLIGTAVVAVLSVLAIGGLFWLGSRAADQLDRTFGKAAPTDYELKLDQCNIDDFGSPEASGTIVNKLNSRQGYEVKIDFVDDQNIKVADGVTFTGGLEAAQTGTWKVSSFVTGKTSPVTCRITEVNYSPFQ